MTVQKDAIELSKLWIERFVIRLSICPFAARSFNADRISYHYISEDSFLEILKEMIPIINRFIEMNMEEHSNSFVIFNRELSFEKLLSFQNVLLEFLEDLGQGSALQTVVFHPEFVFEEAEYSEHGNFVNRSPLPMIHLLRTDEVSIAIESHENVDDIPDRNKKLLEGLKLQSLDEIFLDSWLDKTKL